MKSRELLEIRNKIIRILKEFKEKTNCKVFLFGSFARGDYVLDSDVDIVVICKEFESMKYTDRIVYVREKLPEDLSFDIIALSPTEFTRKYDYLRIVLANLIEINGNTYNE